MAYCRIQIQDPGFGVYYHYLAFGVGGGGGWCHFDSSIGGGGGRGVVVILMFEA